MPDVSITEQLRSLLVPAIGGIGKFEYSLPYPTRLPRTMSRPSCLIHSGKPDDIICNVLPVSVNGSGQSSPCRRRADEFRNSCVDEAILSCVDHMVQAPGARPEITDTATQTHD